MQALRRIFFWFYPSRPKFAHTKEGESMRRSLLLQVVLHLLFFIVGLAYIGFESMITEIIWGLWAYSVYLTLREMQILVYLITMVLGLFYKAT